MNNEEILKENNVKRFSIILMNPPYSGSLHLKFLYKTIKIADKVVSIQPTEYMYDIGHYCGWNKNNLLENILKHTEDIEELDNPKKIFNINRIEHVGIYKCSQKINSVKYLESSIWNRTLINVAKKFYEGKHLVNKCVRNKDAGKYFVKLFKMHFSDDYSNYINDIIVPKDNNNTSYGINFNSEEEKNNFIDSIKTWPYKIMYILKDNQITHLPWLGDYSHKWTDEMLYKHFNISNEDRKVIENTINKNNNYIKNADKL